MQPLDLDGPSLWRYVFSCFYHVASLMPLMIQFACWEDAVVQVRPPRDFLFHTGLCHHRTILIINYR
jgi:hypothetical protein